MLEKKQWSWRINSESWRRNSGVGEETMKLEKKKWSWRRNSGSRIRKGGRERRNSGVGEETEEFG